MSMQSEQIGELFTALSKAQGEKDEHLEARLCAEVCRKIHGPFTTAGNYKKNQLERFIEKICFGLSECWLWYGCRNNGGYGTFKGVYRVGKAHRISWEMFKGEIPRGLKVLHKCDIPNCVNPDHLFLGTQKDNVKDMMKKGRFRKRFALLGEDNPVSKLTNESVKNIRKLYETGEWSCLSLAKKFGVSPMTICRAKNSKSWRHV